MKSLKRLLGTPDRDEFARMMMDAIKRTGTTKAMEYDRDNFKLSFDDDSQLFLHNAYADYSRVPRSKRAETLRRYAALPMNIEELSPPLEEALPNLLPMVRDRCFYEFDNLRSQAEGRGAKQHPIQQLADHLAVGLAHDAPETIRHIIESDLSGWNISFEHALERARDNLWQRSGGKFEKPVAGLYVSPWHDSYDSSRLFLYDLIWHLEVDGEHVAAVPTRDTLIVTGSEDYGGLAIMAKMCEKAQDATRVVSCIPVMLQGKRWVSYLPGPGHPEYQAFKKLRTIEQARNCTEQESLLKTCLAKAEEPVIVASYMIVKDRNSGAYVSYCVWSEGRPVLLPQADQVGFVTADNKAAGSAPWDRVREIAGDMMKPMGTYPERFKVQDFPSPKQLAAMGLQ